MSSPKRHRPPLAAIALVAAVAVALLASAPGEGRAARPPAGVESGVLVLGSRGPAVRALQRVLRRRGFPIAADGVYGPGTRLAVARLQKRLGLRVNGTVDRPLLWWMGISVCDLPGPTTARGGGASRLRLGAYGPRVCALQRVLSRAGLRVGIDGGYGPITRAAVRRAQRRVGLPVSGVSDDRLVARLRARPRAPRPGPAARPPAGTVFAIGAEGPGVRRLQLALRRQGFGVAADGAFGPRTRRAVARLQKKLGLRVNGAVDAGLLRRVGATRALHLQVFPVEGPHWFQNDYGAPRHQGKHEGNDIFGAKGAHAVAVAPGVIERMTRVEQGLGGIYLWLRDDAGTGYYYAHLSSISPGLAPGSRVAVGQRLGVVGNTGDARGGARHLHFQMHPGGGGPVNPYPELRAISSGSTPPV